MTPSGEKAAPLLWDERIGLVRKHNRPTRCLAIALRPNRGERKIEANKEGGGKKAKHLIQFQFAN